VVWFGGLSCGQPLHLLWPCGNSPGIKRDQLVRPVKQSQRVIDIAVHPHIGTNIVMAILVGRDLQSQALKAHTVVVIDLTTSLWGSELMAPLVRVQRSNHAVAGNGLIDSMKTRCCCLLVTKEHAGVFVGGGIQGNYQIPHRTRHPAVGAGVLVDHHARQWHALASDVVLASDFASSHHTSALEHALYPAVTSQTSKLDLVLAVKVDNVPTSKAALIQRYGPRPISALLARRLEIWHSRLSSNPSSPSASKRSIWRRKLRSYWPSNRGPPHSGSGVLRTSRHRLLEISSSVSPARSGPGSWGRVASLLRKPDRLLAKNRITTADIH
jgi:hypothetical protein